MEEHLCNKSFQEADRGSPGPSRRLRENENETPNENQNITQERECLTPEPKRPCLTKNVNLPLTSKNTYETPYKTKINEKEQSTPKTKKNIKRNTVTGDEYQRILQILIRHRGYQTGDVKIGSDVSDVASLDDVVYCTEKSCRFFQIKHSKTSFTRRNISYLHIFQNNFPEIQKKENMYSSPKIKSKKCDLHLVLYFKPFLQINDNSRYKNLEIEELTFITNQTLMGNSKYKNLLIPVSNGLKDDELLHFPETTAVKYSLNVEFVRLLFEDYMKEEYKKYMSKGNENMIIDWMRFEGLVDKFLTKIRIVISYPDIGDLRYFTMTEVFGKDFHCKEVRETLLHCLVHMEIELLSSDNEYLTYEEWKTNKDKVKSFIDQIKMIGITDYESKTLLWKGDLELVFDSESINNMIRDLDLKNFLETEDSSFLHICKVKNVELNVVNILSFLKSFLSENSLFLQHNLFCCRLKGLISTDNLLNGVLEQYQLLVLWNSDIVVNRHQPDNCPFTETANKILSTKSSKRKTRKIIFISDNDDFLCSCIVKNKIPNYSSKQYRLGFKDLTGASKEEILNKMITFQGKTVSFGSIFQNNIAFAENVIDEDCLWELMNPRQPECLVSNTEAFSSLGYDKDYYIPRTFSQTDHSQERHSENSTGTPPRSENKMIKSLGSGKTIIVVGDSGVGKSTVLTHVANLLNKKYKNMWIVRVNLRQLFRKNKLKDFGKVKDCKSAIKMAFKMAFPNGHNSLEKALFEEGLKGKRLVVVFLMDGFNEIGTTTQKRVCDFVNACQKHLEVYQCWITTQSQCQNNIEKQLSVRSHLLNPLSDEDQISLLVKYWSTEYAKRSPPEEHSDEELRADATEALNNWKQCISDETEKTFTSNSLNLKMLADILLERNRKLETKLRLFNLYETFVDYKFLCYTTETSQSGSGSQRDINMGIDEAKEKLFAYAIRKVIRRISAERIISGYATQKVYDKNKIPGKNVLDKYNSCVGEENQQHLITLSKIGLLTVKDGELELSHFSFAQFFFSEYLVVYFKNGYIQEFLMNHVMSDKTLSLCRRFLEELFMRQLATQSGNEIPFYYRKFPSVLNDAKLNSTSINIFMKQIQISVVMEENLVNTIRFFVKKHFDGKQCKTFLHNTIKYRFNPFIKRNVMKDLLYSVESLIKGIPGNEICNLWEEITLIPKPKSYDEAEERAEYILELIKTTAGLSSSTSKAKFLFLPLSSRLPDPRPHYPLVES